MTRKPDSAPYGKMQGNLSNWGEGNLRSASASRAEPLIERGAREGRAKLLKTSAEDKARKAGWKN